MSDYQSSLGGLVGVVVSLVLLVMIGLAYWVVTTKFINKSSGGSSITQSYWYCWDSGAASPHHLGHHVSGDHFCTNGELHSAGISGY